MKTVIAPKGNQRGSILLIILVITFIIGMTLASYLIMAQNQNASVVRSQTWNASLAIGEAGVEDSLAMLNINKLNGKLLNMWTNDASGCNWEQPSATVYHVRRYLGTNYYDAYITNVNNAPIIRSDGVVPWSYSSTNAPTRRLVVRTRLDPLFDVAMAAKGTIDLKGNGISSDSFDSGNTNYSTNGRYDRAKRKAGGDIVTNSTITNSVFNIGNANIAGHVKTGPYGSLGWGPNDSVGDLPWVDVPTPGIKPGWYANDLNVVFDDVLLPDVAWMPPAALGQGGTGFAPDLRSYNHIFLKVGTLNTADNPGYYRINDSGTIYVGTNASVVLNIVSSTWNPNYVFVAGVAPNEVGRLVGYWNGPPGQSVSLGTEDKTQSGKAENLVFLGLPNCTALSYKGNGDFTGVIYAPQADFQLAGGGSGTIDFTGASVTRTIFMNGHYNFHYDENLRQVGPSRGYVPVDWKEVK